MPPRQATTAAAAAAAPAADAAVMAGKRKRTTVAEVDAAAAAKTAAAEASKPKRARAESVASSKPKAAAAAASRKKTKRSASAPAAAAAAAAPPRDRYPDKSIPALLGCATALRAFCLSYPGAFEDFPWKHRVFKVGSSGADSSNKGKIFAYVHGDPGITVGLGVKLPVSGAALVKSHGFAEAMGYGMGKHGWVSLTLPENLGPEQSRAGLSLHQAKLWIDESYRAIANKTQIKQIEVDLS